MENIIRDLINIDVSPTGQAMLVVHIIKYQNQEKNNKMSVSINSTTGFRILEAQRQTLSDRLPIEKPMQGLCLLAQSGSCKNADNNDIFLEYCQNGRRIYETCPHAPEYVPSEVIRVPRGEQQ
jgi:hypothetical protein